MNRQSLQIGTQRAARRIALAWSLGEFCRAWWLRRLGATIGAGTRIPPRTLCTWPHQLSLGEQCVLQPDIFFNFDHFWTPGPSINIGNRVFLGRGCEFNIRYGLIVRDACLIASGCVFVDHDHAKDPHSGKMISDSPGAAIDLGTGVWIGANAVILKGVCIGDYATIGAGAVVTHSVPAGETWGGVPARRLKNPNAKHAEV